MRRAPSSTICSCRRKNLSESRLSPMTNPALDPSGPACALVRQQLPDLMHERLDEVTAVRIRKHLAECEACGEALANLILDQAASNPETLPPSPVVPPIALYEAFLRARQTRFGTLWKSVRDALDAADVAVLEWGRQKRDAIGRGLGDLLTKPAPATAFARGGGAPRVRGAVRTRGAAGAPRSPNERPPDILAAEVVGSDSAPTGQSLSVRLTEPPHITVDGRFRLRCEVDAPDVDGRIALCTVALGEGEDVSFTGVLARRSDRDACDVHMDEANVAAVPGAIPLERISLFITRS